MYKCKANSLPLASNHKFDIKFLDDEVFTLTFSYVEVIGCLMYVMVCLRSNLAYCISLLSRLMMKLRQEYWNIIKVYLDILKGLVMFVSCLAGLLIMSIFLVILILTFQRTVNVDNPYMFMCLHCVVIAYPRNQN